MTASTKRKTLNSATVKRAGSTELQRAQLAGPVSIINRTTALTVVAATPSSNSIELTLRNDGAKPITAFVVSPGGYSVEIGLPETSPLMPGATYRHILGGRTSEVIVKAVIFTDGDGEGEAAAIGNFLQEQEGELAQIRQIAVLIKMAGSSPDSHLGMAVRDLKDAIATLPETREGSDPVAWYWFNTGLHNAKGDALNEVERAEALLTSFNDPSAARRQLLATMNQKNRSIEMMTALTSHSPR